jgi:hypothetical protein
MRSRIVMLVVVGLAAATGLAFAAQPGTLAPTAPEPEPPTYRPVTSDLMTAFIQPRHIKLWLAGVAKNWDYAEYERNNIGGALARLATAVPTYQGQNMKALVAAFATPQLAALQEAIKAKDETAFAQAYDELTIGCNQCHQATGHAMVVMQTPHQDDFPDQVFSPPSK